MATFKTPVGKKNTMCATIIKMDIILEKLRIISSNPGYFGIWENDTSMGLNNFLKNSYR